MIKLDQATFCFKGTSFRWLEVKSNFFRAEKNEFKYWKGFKFSLIAVTTHLIPKRQKDQKSDFITPGNTIQVREGASPDAK